MEKMIKKMMVAGLACLAMCGTTMARPLATSSLLAPTEPRGHALRATAPARQPSVAGHPKGGSGPHAGHGPVAKRPIQPPTHNHDAARHPPRAAQVTVIVDNGPSYAELELERQQLELERQQLEQEKQNNRALWEITTRDRDLLLQDAALGANDGKCANYFCGTRCQLRASTEGFCARHYREIVKGIKDQLYTNAAANRYP